MRRLALLALAGAIVLAIPGSASAYTMKKLWEVKGTSTSQYLGYSVSDIGDVDGDGVPDMVAGAYVGNYAIVISGSSGATLHTFNGTSSGDYFGFGVGGGGDVNGDGTPDIIVGTYNGYYGYAQVFSGADWSTLYTFKSSYSGSYYEYFGRAVDIVGDMNKDGYDEILIGAFTAYDTNFNYSYCGQAYVYSGKDGSKMYTWDGYYSSSYFGYSVHDAGDVNRDGYPDVVVGGYYYSDSSTYNGHVSVFSGYNGKQLYKWAGYYSGGYLGYDVAGAGDVNADGYDDIVAGEPYYYYSSVGYTTGAARVFSGRTGSLMATVYGPSQSNTPYFGYSVDGSGDLNGDGYADIIVGATYALNGSGYYSGNVYAVSPMTSTTIYTVYGPNYSSAYFGFQITELGDLNGDGMSDLGVGCPYNNSYQGSAYIYTTPAPTGSIIINSGALATAVVGVTLDLTWASDTGTVTGIRIRNSDEDWTDWMALSSSVDWNLSPGQQVSILRGHTCCSVCPPQPDR